MKTHRTTIVDGSFECPCVWQNGIELTGIPCDPICCTHSSGFVVGRSDSNYGKGHKPYPVPAIRYEIEYNPLYKDLSLYEYNSYYQGFTTLMRYWFWDKGSFKSVG